VAYLYEGDNIPIAPILHYALTGTGMRYIYVVMDDSMGSPGKGTPIAAALLNAPEAAFPIGEGVNPIAWVVSDMMTHPNCRRQGAAFLLLRYMEGVVVRNGGRIIYLFTENDNAPAMSLYEKAGYQRLKDQKDKAVYAKLITE
jgi:ribosomal protein S18 acetylase RimI-like enzyme